VACYETGSACLIGAFSLRDGISKRRVNASISSDHNAKFLRGLTDGARKEFR
jgi:hypothetical protein